MFARALQDTYGITISLRDKASMLWQSMSTISKVVNAGDSYYTVCRKLNLPKGCYILPASNANTSVTVSAATFLSTGTTYQVRAFVVDSNGMVSATSNWMTIIVTSVTSDGSLSLIGDTERFSWEVTRLRYAFDTDHYIRAGISTQAVTSGSSSISGIVDYRSAYEPWEIANEHYTDPKTISYSPGIYTFYGWVHDDNGLYYSAGSATVVVGSSQSGATPYIYTGSKWEPATAYIFNGSTWVEAAPYIYSSGWKPS